MKKIILTFLMPFVFFQCKQNQSSENSIGEISVSANYILNSKIKNKIHEYLAYYNQHPLKRKAYQIFISEKRDTTCYLIKTTFYRSDFLKRSFTCITNFDSISVFVYTSIDKFIKWDSISHAKVDLNKFTINDLNKDGTICKDSLLDLTFYILRIKEIDQLLIVDTLRPVEVDYEIKDTVKFFR